MPNKKIIPIIVMVIAVAAFSSLAYVAVTSHRSDITTTNTVNTKLANVSVNTNSAVNTNTSTTNANTNTGSTALYDAPTGPFTIDKSQNFAFAARQSTDRLVTRVYKTDAVSGDSIITAQIRSTDIPLGLSGQLATSPTNFQFGQDGDSIVFLSSNTYNGTPYSGIYRTSFTSENKIEKIVQYDPTNLFNGDVPLINDVAFDAPHNRAVFLIGGTEGKENTYLMMVDLATKKVQQVNVWSTLPQFVGFVSDGTAFQIFRRDDDNTDNAPKGKGYLENVNLATGKITKSTLIYNEAAFSPKLQVYEQQAGISPNARVFAFSSYDNSANQTYFWNIATKELTTPSELLNSYASGFIWSPDSGKVYFQNNGNGSIFDLAKGVVATIPKGSQGVSWWPGAVPIVRNQKGDILSYNVETKKSTTLLEGSGGSEGYGGGDSLLGWNWVNR